MQQDDDWVRNDSTLHNNLFYHFRLIELGPKKFATLVAVISNQIKEKELNALKKHHNTFTPLHQKPAPNQSYLH